MTLGCNADFCRAAWTIRAAEGGYPPPGVLFRQSTFGKGLKYIQVPPGTPTLPWIGVPRFCLHRYFDPSELNPNPTQRGRHFPAGGGAPPPAATRSCADQCAMTSPSTVSGSASISSPRYLRRL